MPRTVSSYRVFVASAGDVQPERDAVKDAVESVNRTLGPSHDKHLDLWRWEERALPGLHRDGAQALINPELDEADVVVVIIWNRVGVGTAEEIARAIARWESKGEPRVMVYFSRQPAVLDTAEACDQRKEVIKLRDAIGKQGLYESYDSVDAFADKIRDHLAQVLAAL